jgi:hypothetical protein
LADGLVEISPSRALITAGWEHVPHLTEQAKAELLAGTPPHLREARSTGAPSMGAGAIYPIPFSEISVKPFAIPAYWPRGYVLDVGWRVTAALWGAWDRETDTLYAYSEHYRKEAPPAIHADAIKARGPWMKGGIDPAAQGRAQKDGEQLLAIYRGLGLDVRPAPNAVESGIYEVWSRMETGRFKVFSTLAAFADEFRIYRRDDKGRVVKENDHLMDCARMMALGFRDFFTTRPVDRAAARGRVVGQDTVGY